MSQLHLIRGGKQGQGEGTGYPKASLLLRAGARIVDAAIAWAFYVSFGPAGVVLALLYILFADGMLQGQSPGKKIFGVKVVFLPTRSGARHRDSVLRNAPFGLIIILSMMPELGHRAFFAGLAVIGSIEALQCLRDRDGVRLGDGWAQTQVIDGKVQADQPQRLPAEQEARAPARLREQPSELRRERET
ncbi:MAG: RDD family protein [Myxococcaceae bacterium]